MAKVLFKRVESSDYIDNINVEDGNFIVTGDGRSYIDYGENRIAIAGTPDTTMSDISTNAVANKTVKEYVDTNIETVNSNIHNGFLLWTNPNPTSNFAGQTITLNDNDYDIIEWYFYSRASSHTNMYFTKTYKGCGGQINDIINLNPGSSQTTGVRQRTIKCNSDTSYTISNGLFRDGPSATVPGVDNDVLVPVYAVGYKTGLFD